MMTLSGSPDLSQFPPFSALGEEALRYLQQRQRAAHFVAGDEICRAGQRGGFLAIIARGQVRLSGAQDRQRILQAGQSFGEGMLRYGVPSSFSASAESELLLWAVTRQDWLAAQELDRRSKPEPLVVQSQPVAQGSGWLRPGLVAVLFLITAFIILGPPLLRFTRSTLFDLALEAGRPDLAAKYLPYVADWLPDPSQSYDTLGYALYEQGRRAEALVALQQAVLLDDQSASAQNNYGVALLQQGRSQDAMAHLQQAVELDPGNASLYHNLGNAYLATGDLEAAADAYQQAFDLNPALADARSHWGGIAFSQGRTSEAQAAWEKVLASQPENFLALQGLGMLAVQQANPVQAIAYLEKAISLKPENAVTCFYLGLALEADRRPVQAAGFYRQALALSADPALTHLVLAQLNSIYRQNDTDILLIPRSALEKGR